MKKHLKLFKLQLQYYWQLLFCRIPLLILNDDEETCYCIASTHVVELKIELNGIKFTCMEFGKNTDRYININEISHIEGVWAL